MFKRIIHFHIKHKGRRSRQNNTIIRDPLTNFAVRSHSTNKYWPFHGPITQLHSWSSHEHPRKEGLLYFAKRIEAKRNENLYFAKWKICTLRNGKSVLCEMENLYFAKWKICTLRNEKSVLCEMKNLHFAK